jgi:hypothetical protein
MIDNKYFVPLHFHSSFSAFDGLAPVKKLVHTARKMGFRSVALTDHGNISGWIQFIQECYATTDKNGNSLEYPTIKPILGVETYLARKMEWKSKEHQPDLRKGNRHLILLAKNWNGYQNICRLVDKSWTEGFYFDPRIDLDILSKHSNGIVCGSACFLEDQYIETGKGLKKIIDLSLNDIIFNKYGKPVKIKTLTTRKYSGFIYEISAKGHFGEIQCTQDHKIYVYDNNSNNFKWVKSENIDKNKHFLTYPVCKYDNSNNKINLWDFVKDIDWWKTKDLKNIREKEIFLNEDICYLFGLYLSEGGMSNFGCKINWTFNLKEKKIVKDVERILFDQFSLHSVIRERPELNRIDIEVFSVELKYLIKFLLGIKSNGKYIHYIIKNTNIKNKIALLRGAFLGDGYFEKRKEGYGKFTYASVSRSLINDIRYICTSLGFITSSTSYGKRIDKNNVRHKKSYYIMSYGGDGFFAKSIMDNAVDFSLLKNRNYNKRYKIIDNKLILPIKNIVSKKVKKIDVYCLNEPDTNSFLADGFIVHNCLSNVINANLYNDRYDKAKKAASIFKDIFKDDFYLEIMFHGINTQQKIIPDILKLGKELDIPICATQDTHYLEKNQKMSQEVLMCASTNKCLKDPKHISMPYGEFYLKSATEMMEIFKDIPQVVYNTIAIAEKIDTDDIVKNLFFTGMHLPKIDIPQPFNSPQEYMEHLAWEGMKRVGWDKSQKHIDRLKMEIADVKVAKENNNYDFATYFLIVRDYINYAKSKDILVGPGRGSGFGSALLRCLGITWGNVDPIKYGLIWERFLGFSESRYIIDKDFGFDNIQPTETITNILDIENINEEDEEE